MLVCYACGSELRELAVTKNRVVAQCSHSHCRQTCLFPLAVIRFENERQQSDAERNRPAAA